MADSSTYTPDTLNRRAMYAQQLLQQGSDTSPIKSWTQGAARLAQALVGGMALRKDTEQQGEASKSLAAFLMGGQQGSQTPASSPPIAPVSDTGGDASMPRGYRNNNPLNIEAGSFTQGQPGFAGSDGRFAKFASLNDGTAAANKLLDTYQNKYGLNTPAGIVGRWAPSSDGNNVSSYAADVAGKLGIDPNAQIPPEMRPQLIRAMAQHENGAPMPQQAAPQQPAPQPAPQMQPPQQMAQAQPQQMPQGAPPQMQQPDMRAVITKMLQSDNPYVQRQAQALASALITKRMTPPEWKQIGQTIMGQPQYGWVDSNNQTVTSANPQGGSGQGMMPAGIDENKPMYDQLPKPQQQVVDSMLAGRMPMPSSMALKTPYWNTLISAANERAVANGSHFDATDWKQRFDTASDFSTKGKTGQSMNALDTVQGHLEKLSDDVEKLDNGGWSYWNAMRNGIANTTPLDPARTKAVQAVNDDTKAVTDEMARAYKSGAMSDKEISEWQKLISSADSKEKQRQALTDFVHLLNTKRQTNYSQYEKVMGKPYVSQNEGSNARIQKLIEDRNNGTQQQSAPAQGGLPQGWSVQVH